MERFYPKTDPHRKILEPQKRVRIELNMYDIVADSGLRKPIYDFWRLEMKLREHICLWVHVNHVAMLFHGNGKAIR
jgi:hypothetical protein